MVKMRGGIFATPRERALFAVVGRMAQQVEVAVLHESDAGADQANRAVAQVVGFPGGTGGNPPGAKEHVRDRPAGFAGEMTVDGAKGEAQPFSSLRLHTPWWRR